MARYRAKRMLFTDRLILSGEEFTSSLVPGRNWEPLDDEAKAAVKKRGALPDDPALPGTHKTPLVEIPENWRDLQTAGLIGLARKLGAPEKGTGKKESIAKIEAELEARKALVPA